MYFKGPKNTQHLKIRSMWKMCVKIHGRRKQYTQHDCLFKNNCLTSVYIRL